jgi:hypothetical protein
MSCRRHECSAADSWLGGQNGSYGKVTSLWIVRAKSSGFDSRVKGSELSLRRNVQTHQGSYSIDIGRATLMSKVAGAWSRTYTVPLTGLKWMELYLHSSLRLHDFQCCKFNLPPSWDEFSTISEDHIVITYIFNRNWDSSVITLLTGGPKHLG